MFVCISFSGYVTRSSLIRSIVFFGLSLNLWKKVVAGQNKGDEEGRIPGGSSLHYWVAFLCLDQLYISDFVLFLDSVTPIYCAICEKVLLEDM